MFSKKKYWLYLRLRIEQCGKFETNLGYLRAKKKKKKKMARESSFRQQFLGKVAGLCEWLFTG